MTLSERIYRFLLKAYPKRYLERYEEPMAQLFRDQLQAAIGARARLLLWLRTLVDLLVTVPAHFKDYLYGRRRWFSEPAMRTVFFARHTATRLGHPEITAEDLLVGLIRENREIRGLLRQEALEEIRRTVDDLVAKPEGRAALPHLPLSNAAKEILALANLEAERSRAKKIMARHLAAGILIQGRTPAADLLRQNGISLDRLRTR